MDVSNVQQNVYVIGDHNSVVTSGGDVYGAPPPPPDSAQPVPAGAPHRRLGRITGGLALAAALVIGTLLPPARLSRPALWPEGTTALCRDGRYSPSHHRSGTCSSHGGVAYWRFPTDDPLWRP
jgi:hypothetical protein